MWMPLRPGAAAGIATWKRKFAPRAKRPNPISDRRRAFPICNSAARSRSTVLWPERIQIGPDTGRHRVAEKICLRGGLSSITPYKLITARPTVGRARNNYERLHMKCRRREFLPKIAKNSVRRVPLCSFDESHVGLEVSAHSRHMRFDGSPGINSLPSCNRFLRKRREDRFYKLNKGRGTSAFLSTVSSAYLVAENLRQFRYEKWELSL